MNETADQKPQRDRRRSANRIFMGFVTAVVILLILVFLIHPDHVRRLSLEDICRANLRSLGAIMLIYADDHGTYPTGDRWCDLIKEYDDRAEILCCPRSSVSPGQSTYVMNSSAAGGKPDDFPKDMILLFESVGGWNQSGGAELLTTENHEGKGCNVLFVNGTVGFVRPDEIAGLKWTDEGNLGPDVRNARPPGAPPGGSDKRPLADGSATGMNHR